MIKMTLDEASRFIYAQGKRLCIAGFPTVGDSYLAASEAIDNEILGSMGYKDKNGPKLTITKDEQGHIVAVTRQDSDGKILDVIDESTPYEVTPNDQLAKDYAALKAAGNRLALAAQYTITEYDGLHRLSSAASEWNHAVAAESGRGS